MGGKSIRVQPAAVLVPSFTLQPVVENAYSHGLKSCEEGGRILLRAWMQAACWCSRSRTTEGESTAEELDTLQAQDRQSEQTGRSIGLGNFPRRMGCCIRWQNPGIGRAGRGTVVRFDPRGADDEKKEGENLREVQIAGGRDN